MIVVDTNVLSELMREAADERVLAWFAGLSAVSLFTTALSEAEIRYGLALLPAGKRRRALEAAADGLFSDFGQRILPFDSIAAQAYVRVVVTRRRAGRPISLPDAQIAAIARSRDASLATRNTSDFTGCGVKLIDPWRPSA